MYLLLCLLCIQKYRTQLMGHPIRLRVTLNLGKVKRRFRQAHFRLVELQVNRFLVQYACHVKIINFGENFGSSMVRFGSIWVQGSLLSKFILAVGFSMNSSYLIWVSSVELVLLTPLQQAGPLETEKFSLRNKIVRPQFKFRD